MIFFRSSAINNRIIQFFFCLSATAVFSQQNLSLSESISSAKENSTAISIAQQSYQTRKNLYDATKQNYLPKVDVLAGYNYLGEKAKLNVQGAKDDVVNYSSGQITGTAGQIYQQITGNQMPTDIQQLIYSTSHDLLNSIYPSGNPEIGKQGYLMAGIFLRQPIYLGGKLKAAQDLARIQMESGGINLENAQEISAYNTTLQYIQIMYLNAMIARQHDIVTAQHKNQKYAGNLVKAEILPPYQKNWADIAAKQAETILENLKLEKENALLALKSAIGDDLDKPVEISAELSENFDLPELGNITAQNTDTRLLASKKTEAEAAEKLTGTVGKPNIFAVGNVQLFRKDLPIILPPWLIGIEMQWTVFDNEKKSRNLAAKSLVEETNLLITQKEEAVNLALKTTQNKLISLKNQTETLNQARKQTYITTEMVRKRMENSLSSIKDVNDALQLQYEAEKLYYTSTAAYYTALATYFYLAGKPEEITRYIQ